MHDESLKRVPHVLAFTLRPHFASHGIHHFLCDEEPEVGASHIHTVRVLRADELIEHFLEGFYLILEFLIKHAKIVIRCSF